MNLETILKVNLYNDIEKLTSEKQTEVKDFVEFLINKSQKIVPKKKSLEGIWKDTNFDKIPELENKISNLRKAMSNNILDKRM